VKSLISIDDLTDDDLRSIVDRGLHFADRRVARPLEGLVVGVYFAKTSTRTRTAFSSGALRLGAGLVTYGPDDLQTNTGETIEDTGRVFARMLDIVVARTAGDPMVLRAWASADAGSDVDGQPRHLGVINAMTADEHPTQALADLTTLAQRFRRIEGLRVLYVGEGNNTATALALALTRFKGVVLELRTPPDYGLPADFLERARAQAARTGAEITEQHHMEDLPSGFDVIYTTRWQTTGTAKHTADWRETFAPFQVGAGLWKASPKAVFMHDLPAHRGEEVTAEVLDGTSSIAFRQAENKMHSAMAVLEWSRS
jgi:ornithine carbamoyltransferase